MTVRADDEIIWLEGDCHVEDAEALVAQLLHAPARVVDLSQCRHLHSAVIQALLVLKPKLRGQAQDPFLRTWILADGAEAGLDGNPADGAALGYTE